MRERAHVLRFAMNFARFYRYRVRPATDLQKDQMHFATTKIDDRRRGELNAWVCQITHCFIAQMWSIQQSVQNGQFLCWPFKF
jgi:hypothetical protein